MYSNVEIMHDSMISFTPNGLSYVANCTTFSVEKTMLTCARGEGGGSEEYLFAERVGLGF